MSWKVCGGLLSRYQKWIVENQNRYQWNLDEKRSELQLVNGELASAIEKAEDAKILLDRIKNFVSSFRLFAPHNRRIC